MTETHPTLRRLAYHRLHQDWDLVARDPDDIVRNVARYDGADAAQTLIGELEDVLAENSSEDELEQMWIHDLRSGFEPREVNMTYREWFTHVVEVLRAATGPLSP